MKQYLDSQQVADMVAARYTCKVFDKTKKIPPDQWAAIRQVLQNAPSSVNSQPWYFYIAASDAAKKKVAMATGGEFTYNKQKLLDCSHVVVFCRRRTVDENHMATLLAQEEKDGRFKTPEAKAGGDKARHYYVGLHNGKLHDAHCWMEKQTYLAFGMGLLAAAALGVDSCPIEGFDSAVMDEVLQLPAKGLTSVVVAAFGYRAANDANATAPKSRLPQGLVMAEE